MDTTKEMSIVINNDREKLFQKLENFKTDNSQSMELERKNKHIESFLKSFRNLSCELFNVEEKQLKTLSIDELKEIEALLCEKVKNKSIIHKIILIPFFLTPIVGWFVYLLVLLDKSKYEKPTHSWQYIFNRKELMKLNKNDFPYDEVFKRLPFI